MITIAHLYYDILNLYGEVGNVRILKRALEQQELKVKVVFLTVGDKLEFSKYDFVYMGMGIEENLEIVNEHLKKYKNQITKYIEDGKPILCTGNSYELFGKQIQIKDKKIETLGLFDYKSKLLDERKVLEVSAKSKFIKEEIIGFMNTRSYNNNNKNIFVRINDFKEGVLYKNLIGTYIIGPILVRNPKLLEKIIMCILEKKGKKYNNQKSDFEFLNQAYLDCLERRAS